MKLLDLYEDLFQAICRLNRVARTNAHPDYGRVRSDMEELLDDIPRKAGSDAYLVQQVRALELPIIFFVDNVICTSSLKFASQWATNRLAYKKNELAGDEKFFDFLNADLKDPGDAAAERLAVYYTCLGLGFTGMYVGQPERLRRYNEEIFARIRRWIDTDPKSKVSDQAYRHTDKRTLTEPPSHALVLISIAFVFLSLSVLVVYYGLYARALQELDTSLDTIVKHERTK